MSVWVGVQDFGNDQLARKNYQKVSLPSVDS